VSGSNLGQARTRGKPKKYAGTSPTRRTLTLRDLHRARILVALAAILEGDGSEQATVTKVVQRARVPRTAFYQLFADRDDALCTLVGNAFERTRSHVIQSAEAESGWQHQTKAGLHALLTLFEAEPELARLCLIHSRVPARGMQSRRRAILKEVARHIDAGAQNGRLPPSTLTAESTVAGVLGVIEARLEEHREPRLTSLCGPLMSFIMLPYRGGAEARVASSEPRARSRPRPRPTPGEPAARLRITYRTMRVLMTIANTPGLSNLEVARRAGIADQGQMSKLLKRLTAMGLVENTGGSAELGSAHAWALTEEGRAVERSILDYGPWST